MVSRRCTNIVPRLRNVLWKLVPLSRQWYHSGHLRSGDSASLTPCHHHVITDSVTIVSSQIVLENRKVRLRMFVFVILYIVLALKRE